MVADSLVAYLILRHDEHRRTGMPIFGAPPVMLSLRGGRQRNPMLRFGGIACLVDGLEGEG